MSQNQTPETDKEDGIQETFLSHLFELRDRLIKSVGAL
jgi:sec-independent protein translocase protein TatC